MAISFSFAEHSKWRLVERDLTEASIEVLLLLEKGKLHHSVSDKRHKNHSLLQNHDKYLG